MTSPPSPFAISPAAAVAADLPNDPDLTIVGFLKSPDSLPLYLLIGMIVYTVSIPLLQLQVQAENKTLEEGDFEVSPEINILAGMWCEVM